jgi:hypothetical protein
MVGHPAPPPAAGSAWCHVWRQLSYTGDIAEVIGYNANLSDLDKLTRSAAGRQEGHRIGVSRRLSFARRMDPVTVPRRAHLDPRRALGG